jgi:hypothetical protein
MAIGCLLLSFILFVSGASSLSDILLSSSFAILIVLFFSYFYLFGTFCGYYFWGIHSNSSPSVCFVCVVDLLRTFSTVHCLLLCLFSHIHRDELPTPLFVLVSDLHAIGSLLVVVICIVCFFLYC